MKCAFCREEIQDGAAKCKACHEFLVPRDAKAESSAPYSKLKFVAELTTALAWPVIVLALVATLHDDLSSLMKRVRAVEVAGTKSEFVDYAAAFGYLEKKVADIASEPSPEGRERLSAEIQQVTSNLQGLHPFSLGFLIEIGRGVGRDDAWGDTRYKAYLFELKQRGFVALSPDPTKATDLTTETRARLSPSGTDFLRRLGLRNSITDPPTN